MLTVNRVRSITVIMGILLVLLLMPSAVFASDWDQFQENTYNNGITQDKAPVTSPVGNGISWENSYSLGGSWSGFDNVPVVAGDILYIAGDDNKLRALYKVNGTEIWATSTSGGRVVGNMAAGNGSIFVPTSDGKIFAVDMDSGAVQWSATESGQLITPVVYDDHKIYFGSWNAKKYYCYYDNGTKCWERASTTGDGYYWAGAAVIGDYLVYGDDAGYLTSVYKDNGTTVDSLDISAEFNVTANEIRSSVSYVEDTDRIYFTSKGNYIYTLSMNEDGTFSTADKAYANIGYSTSTPAIYNDKVYVGSSGYLTCLYADNLTRDWRFSVSGQIQSSPAISTAYDEGDGEIYIYFTENWGGTGIYCVNESGVEQWSWGESGKTEYTLAGVAISDGWVFFGTDDDYMFGFATNESIDAHSNVIYTDNSISLQETIYAANNGDTIMMAPGTYTIPLVDGKSNLYINKSDLTFMADGGDVIITPASGDSYPSILPGLADSGDNTGCDASGITFSGITFGAFNQIGADPADLEVNRSYSNMKFEDCTFNGGKYYFLLDKSEVLNCVFSGGPQLSIYGDNIQIENNSGAGCRIGGGSYSVSGITYTCSNLTFKNNVIDSIEISYDGAGLFEDNIFDGVSKLYLSDSTDNIIQSNEFLNITGNTRIVGHVYLNTFTRATGKTGYIRMYANGSYYQNNFIDFTNVQLYSGSVFNSSAPVSYSYGSQEFTGYLGNYYSAYGGNDSNGDGIGDDPVTAIGSTIQGGVDNYPLMGAWIATENRIEGEGSPIVPPVANFSANVTSGDESLTVQFTDLSANEPATWSWDFDGDGIEDSAEQNPQFTYTEEGTYSVSLTAGNSAGSDTVTKESYITVGDWNPWNDADSEGSPDGSYITVSEFIEAYNCYQSSSPAPGTGASVDISRLIELYNAYSDSTPM